MLQWQVVGKKKATAKKIIGKKKIKQHKHKHKHKRKTKTQNKKTKQKQAPHIPQNHCSRRLGAQWAQTPAASLPGLERPPETQGGRTGDGREHFAEEVQGGRFRFENYCPQNRGAEAHHASMKSCVHKLSTHTYKSIHANKIQNIQSRHYYFLFICPCIMHWQCQLVRPTLSFSTVSLTFTTAPCPGLSRL